MPEIKINIVDNTSAVLGSTDVYTVFIPGNSKYVNNKTLDNSDYFGKYNLFTSLTDFNKVIKDPEYSTSEYAYNHDDGEKIIIKYADPGYRLAQLALANNLPVLYYIPDYTAEVPSYTTYSEANPQPTSETFDAGTYYTRSGAGTEESPYDYTLAEEFVSETTYYVATEVPAVPAHAKTYAEVKALVNDEKINIFEDLEDKSLFDIRFVTNGGYDWCKFGTEQGETKKIIVPKSIEYTMAVANNRGDCIALIDFAKAIKAKELLADGVDLTSIGATNTPANYAAFVPWITYNEVCLPASAGYLEAFGKQTVNNPNWFATAGFVRGIVSGTPNEVIGELVADKLVKDNGIAINPITRVSTSATNFYNMIWGNRTTYTNSKGLKASSFLNIIQLCCDLSKRLYRASKENMYEQNTDRLWFNFKAPVEEMLNNMLQNEGIEGYKIIRQNATQRAQVRALVKIVPVEAVEKFDITIELTDNLEVSVTIAE